MNPGAASGRIILGKKTSVAAGEQRDITVPDQELRIRQELP